MTSRIRSRTALTTLTALPCLAALVVVAACTSGAIGGGGTDSAGATSAASTAGPSVTASASESAAAPPSGPTSETAAEPESTQAGGEEQFTPILMEVMSTPSWFAGSDGKAHLVYEILLTNGFPSPATPTQLDVLDADSGDTLATLTDDALAAAISPLGQGAEQITEMAPATVGVAWMEVILDDPAQVPARIEHALNITVAPGFPIPEQITSVGAPADVDTDPAIVLGPPLTGPGWIAAPSCCDGPHRRALQPIDNAEWLSQRFAIDFNKISAAGLLTSGDPGVNANWFTYDQPVLAVADGTVTIAADEFEDQIPNDPRPVAIAESDGNYVILQVGDGVYANYAHLKPGSVAVQTGDTVQKGDVIGRTGNTGSSTGPHLHFHMMDRPSALVANGVPFVFDEFTVVGQAPPLSELVTLDPSADPVPVDPANAGPRTNELPLGGNVVEFAGQ